MSKTPIPHPTRDVDGLHRAVVQLKQAVEELQRQVEELRKRNG